MAAVSMVATIAAPADKVWETVRDFNGLPKWIAPIAKSALEGSGVGAVRTLTLGDGAQVTERLESFDEGQRALSYRILSAPLPLGNYVATMQVRELGPGRCEVAWSSTFDPKGASEAEAKAIVEGIYAAGFAGLGQLHGE